MLPRMKMKSAKLALFGELFSLNYHPRIFPILYVLINGEFSFIPHLKQYDSMHSIHMRTFFSSKRRNKEIKKGGTSVFILDISDMVVPKDCEAEINPTACGVLRMSRAADLI